MGKDIKKVKKKVMWVCGRGAFQEEEWASAKALRQECAQRAEGTSNSEEVRWQDQAGTMMTSDHALKGSVVLAPRRGWRSTWQGCYGDGSGVKLSEGYTSFSGPLQNWDSTMILWDWKWLFCTKQMGCQRDAIWARRPPLCQWADGILPAIFCRGRCEGNRLRGVQPNIPFHRLASYSGPLPALALQCSSI